MSKKNTLNEVRRFMALANLDASLSSNFITKLEETDMSYVRDDEEEMMQEEADEEADEADEEEDGNGYGNGYGSRSGA
jgi:CRISPR/Cas system CSM-associated protein Csm5 (group 7 of RAMP superfamily)